MGALKYVAIAVVAAALVVQQRPELLLKIPKIGFIPFAIITGEVPPFFNKQCYTPEAMAGWIRDNDVVVAVGAKSGTNAMLYMSHLVRTKRNPVGPATIAKIKKKEDKEEEARRSRIILIEIIKRKYAIVVVHAPPPFFFFSFVFLVFFFFLAFFLFFFFFFFFFFGFL